MCEKKMKIFIELVEKNIINILGSDTDISTSNENLSMEQRYVLRHTPRAEPQGQENLVESNQGGKESSGLSHIIIIYISLFIYRQ